MRAGIGNGVSSVKSAHQSGDKISEDRERIFLQQKKSDG